MNVRRKWLHVLLAIVLATFAMHVHAANAQESGSPAATASLHAMQHHERREHNSGCVTDCCTIGLCCCLAIAFRHTNLAVHHRNIFSAEDGPSWRLLAARPLVPPPKPL